MSKHEGVTCDSCNKVNFTGHRYKCLVCYDYDLCHECHAAGASSSRHKPEHAMQCILTKHDMSIYFGGEGSGTAFPHQSFTCPYCTKLGFSVPQLQDHVRTCHSDNMSSEIICPICAVQPNGDPNLVTEDLVNHINQMHNNKAIDQSAFASEFLDDATGSLTSQTGNFRQIRRLNHPTRMASFGGPNTQTSALRTTSRPVPMQIIESALSPRDPIDPIAELLSQLTNVRPRGTTTNSGGGAIASHLQHLELQLATTRQQLERFRQVESLARTAVALGGTNNTQSNSVAMGVGPKNLEILDVGTKKEKEKEEKKEDIEVDNRFLMRRGSNTFNQSDDNKDDDTSTQPLRQEYVRELILCTLFPTDSPEPKPRVRSFALKTQPPPIESMPQNGALKNENFASSLLTAAAVANKNEVFGAATNKKFLEETGATKKKFSRDITMLNEELYWCSDDSDEVEDEDEGDLGDSLQEF